MRCRLKSPTSRLATQSFVQAQVKESIKAPRHWPLWGEFTGNPASNAEHVSTGRFWFSDVQLIANNCTCLYGATRWLHPMHHIRMTITHVCIQIEFHLIAWQHAQYFYVPPPPPHTHTLSRPTPTPHPALLTKAYTMLVLKFKKHPFSRILDAKNSLFQPRSLILRTNKPPFLISKTLFVVI